MNEIEARQFACEVAQHLPAIDIRNIVLQRTRSPERFKRLMEAHDGVFSRNPALVARAMRGIADAMAAFG